MGAPHRPLVRRAGRGRDWSAEVDGRRHEAIAWSYEQPPSDMVPITGLVAFRDEPVDVRLDGERRTPPSGTIADTLRRQFGLRA